MLRGQLKFASSLIYYRSKIPKTNVQIFTMASTRDGRRERYSTFGSTEEPKSERLTNRWEIVLVLIVVAAGIVITTIAAIKAKGELTSKVNYYIWALS